MTAFRYKGLAQSGSAITGVVNAESPRLARDSLRNSGIVIHCINDIDDASTESFPALQRMVHTRSLTRVLEDTATHISIGTPLVPALRQTAQDLKGRGARLAESLATQIESGQSLAQAAREHPTWFNPFLCTALEIGERADALEQVLDDILRYRERSSRLLAKLTSTLTYPAIVSVIAIVALMFLLTTTIPPIAELLRQSGNEIPLSTAILIDSAMWLSANKIIAALTVLLLIGATIFAIMNTAVRSKIDDALLATPLLGKIFRRQTSLQITGALHLLLTAGQPLPDALEVVGRFAMGSRLKKQLHTAAMQINEGEQPDAALTECDTLPRSLVRTFATGQRTGKLPEQLAKHIAVEDRKLETDLDRAMSVLEPLVIVTLAIVIGATIFATMKPVLEIGHAIQ